MKEKISLLENIERGLHELQMKKEGKIKGMSAEDFLKELRELK